MKTFLSFQVLLKDGTDLLYKNPDYWKQYRKKHPQKRLRNTLLQRKRNIKRKFHQTSGSNGIKNTSQKVIAKMDVLKGYLSVNHEKVSLDMDLFFACKDGRDSYVR